MSNLQEAELFERHYDFVVHVAMRAAPQKELVYDLVHDVFVDFTRKRDQFDLGEDVRPLLAGMVRIAALKFRESSRKQTISLRILAEMVEAARRQRKGNGNFEDKLDRLDHCLKKLSDQSRKLIERRYFDNEKVQDIAKELGIKDSALRQSLCRIRDALRKCLSYKRDGENNDKRQG